MKIWFCKIGESENLPDGADATMRSAVAAAYRELTGQSPDFIFSGWGGELTEPERAVLNALNEFIASRAQKAGQ